MQNKIMLYRIIAVVASALALGVAIWTRTWFLTILMTCTLVSTLSQGSITDKKVLKIISGATIAVILTASAFYFFMGPY